MKKISLLLVVFASLALVVGAFAADLWANEVVDSWQGPAYSGTIDPDRKDPSSTLGLSDNNGSSDAVFVLKDNQKMYCVGSTPGGEISVSISDALPLV